MESDRNPEDTRVVGEQRCREFLAAVPQKIRTEVEDLPKKVRLMNARPVARVRFVHAVTDRLFEPAGAYAACKPGCAHCCYVSVLITRADADSIGEHVGVKPADIKASTRPDIRNFSYQTPCPFLRDNRCSIYAYRPMACRTHFNFDKDEYWCRHENLTKPGAGVPKPSVRPIHEAYVAASSRSGGEPVTADIRDFFPDLPQP